MREGRGVCSFFWMPFRDRDRARSFMPRLFLLPRFLCWICFSVYLFICSVLSLVYHHAVRLIASSIPLLSYHHHSPRYLMISSIPFHTIMTLLNTIPSSEYHLSSSPCRTRCLILSCSLLLDAHLALKKDFRSSVVVGRVFCLSV